MFWTIINNDGIFNSSATLDSTYRVSLFPIFLVILAVGGFILGAISPQNLTKLQNTPAGGLPGGANGAGGQIVNGVIRQLNDNAGILLITGPVGALTGADIIPKNSGHSTQGELMERGKACGPPPLPGIRRAGTVPCLKPAMTVSTSESRNREQHIA